MAPPTTSSSSAAHHAAVVAAATTSSSSGGGALSGTKRKSTSKSSHSRSYPRGVGLDFRKLAGLTLISYIDHHGKCLFVFVLVSYFRLKASLTVPVPTFVCISTNFLLPSSTDSLVTSNMPITYYRCQSSFGGTTIGIGSCGGTSF